MKKILLSTVALVGLSAAASAADLPRNTAPIAPIVPVPIFTWTGFYVGVNAGYAWNDNNADTFYVAPGGVPGFPGAAGYVTYQNSDSDGGFVGGGQVGYNYQFGQFVVGLEADLQYADLSRDNNAFYTYPGTFPSTYVAPGIGGGVEWFGTVRARLGFAFDRALVYATGGFAYGSTDSSNDWWTTNGNDDIRTGWTLGGGVEYALTNNLILGVEGLWVSLDKDKYAGNGGYYTAGGVVVPVTAADRQDRDNEFGLVRARISYKF